jgi:DNA-binding response OmpR family regulator
MYSRANEDLALSLLTDECPLPLRAQVQVLLVEDDEKLAMLVRTGIEMKGGSVLRAGAVKDAIRLLHLRAFDIVLLDIVLPGESGLQVLHWMRANRPETPVLVLTCRDTIRDRVAGLEAGADDYLVKPFAFPELLARIRALVRRHKPGTGGPLKCADLEIDVKAHIATRAGVSLNLTFREFELLQYLCQKQGCVVSREMLASDIWKETTRYTPLDNVINVHIARLRQKVDGNFSPKLLHTIRRVGFVLREQAT